MLDRAADRARLADAIAADYTTLARELILACPAPAGHRWDVPRYSELHWWCGDVVESTRHGASLFIRRARAEDPDSDQIHVEVRWFWREDATVALGQPARHEAILWCEKGPRSGGFRNLLEANESFPKAERIEDLAATIAARLRRILWP